jgi:glycosyltransferase involved in cell wall biosynthesis
VGQRTVHEEGLRAGLGFPLPSSLAAGGPTALFCYGTCFHPREPIAALEIVVGEARRAVPVIAMPRPDLFASLHPGLEAAALPPGAVDPDSAADPELRSFRSGFWATVTLTAPPASGQLPVLIEARLSSGTRASARLGEIEVVQRGAPSGDALAGRPGEDLVGVCMATFEPDLDLFRGQVDSLRGQTHENWICLVSDDCSAPERFEAIRGVIGDDARFAVSRSEERLGFYRNFERALEMAPAQATFVALCDQDDRWYPDKLETLLGAIEGAELAYSDQRLVEPDGTVVAESLWSGRRNNYTDLASLLVANTVTGAATLFRREVAEAALPFPQMPGWQFHDHWLGLVALARGRIAYVDRPLYDYVQHRGAILGQVAVEPDVAPEPAPAPLRARLTEALRVFLRGWRPIYFCGYLRLEVQAQALLARCAPQLSPAKRRALERFAAADRSWPALARLAVRPVRGLVGRSETLGAEAQLVKGLLWRRITAARTRRRDAVVAWDLDAGFPPCDADNFGQRRLRRWRARHTQPHRYPARDQRRRR